MTYDEVLAQVLESLQRDTRVAYRVLKRRFGLDDEYVNDLKADLIKAKRLAIDEDGEVLVWIGTAPVPSSTFQVSGSQPPTPSTQHLDPRPQTLDARLDAAERRQLTVMFCDLVDSTALSELLDPEEWREVVRAYHETGAGATSRYGGHTAQHLGDGILVYFGYPAAHEDDAQRAVRTGLEIIAGLRPLNARLQPAIKERLPHPIQVRIGIHTGLVVVGEIGSSEKREILAMGETPNIAARLQSLAEPDTVAISGATYRLVQGLFECQDRGLQELKGISVPLLVYRVVREGEAQSRFEVAVRTGLTPLVGRESELELLRQRWEQAKAGAGQVVLLSGEPGIGKSRLMQELKEHLAPEGVTRIEFRCSPYHQNSAFYPLIEHLQRLLQFAPHDTPQAKLTKLQQALAQYRFSQADTFPLLASLLSLPQPEGAPPLTMGPQKQKEKMQAALVAWLVEEAEQNTVYNAWEDLHWADPSTLEVLTLLLDQVPTTRLLMLLTFRPEFMPPWGNRSHLSQLTLSRLGHSQVETMVEKVTGGKALPSEVVQQIVVKTDGVPLFVEELTKTVVESGLVRAEGDRYVGAHGSAPIPPLAIPATLQDALMARLDRLAPVKELAQLGATLGREFSYELLHAVSPLDEGSLQHGLKQLVEAELLYQRGLLPHATYLFKHALIQDTAYQSLLKSRRQQLHQQIAQVLEVQFPETKDTQPELLAHHYTEAGLIAQAIPYWQQAGERASQRSAYVEAISHLTTGLELLKILPDTPERAQQELRLQVALGVALAATKGFSDPERERAFARAQELCEQLYVWHTKMWIWKAAKMAGAACPTLKWQDRKTVGRAVPAIKLARLQHNSRSWCTAHIEQSIALYDPQQHRSLAFLYGGDDPRVSYLYHTARNLWFIGYPEQALGRIPEALTLAQELSYPPILATALGAAAMVHQHRREGQLTQERAEALVALSSEHGFPEWLAAGTIGRGWALAEQGQGEEGITQIHQGLDA